MEYFGLDEDSCYFFLDGPRHDSTSDLEAIYHYFCTSGGHPQPKSGETGILYLWILPGWTASDALDGFSALGFLPDDIRHAYFICGGCAREIHKYLRSSKARQLMVTASSERTQGNNPKNPDRLRTIFRVETDTCDEVILVYQMIDSPFVIRELRCRLSLQTYFNALGLGKAMGSGTVVGVFFEELLHKWFEEVLPGPISSFYQVTGTGAQCVTQLRNINVYWVPSIPNYPNIDADVIVNAVLYVFQYTKRTGHPFNEDTFWQDFVTVVRGQVMFDRIHVYIVTPEYIDSTLTVHFTKHYAPPGRVLPRGAANIITISCTSSSASITTSSLETVQASAEAAFTFAE